MEYVWLIILGIFGVWVGKTLAEKTLKDDSDENKNNK